MNNGWMDGMKIVYLQEWIVGLSPELVIKCLKVCKR